MFVSDKIFTLGNQCINILKFIISLESKMEIWQDNEMMKVKKINELSKTNKLWYIIHN